MPKRKQSCCLGITTRDSSFDLLLFHFRLVASVLYMFEHQPRQTATRLLTFLATVLCCPAVSSAASNNITLLHNASVYTLDKSQPQAQAFAYNSDGVIVDVGSDEALLARYRDRATLIDAQGAMALPGFQDTHVHVPEAGINESLCLLPADKPLDAYEELIANCAEEQAGDVWVRAAGVSLFNFRDSAELPITLLDRAVPDRPALILDDLGHAVWANSMALEKAGIAADAANPQGGVFHRDNTGRLTGLLLEDAQQLVRNAATSTIDDHYEGLLVALEQLAAHGVTGISDAGGYWQQGHHLAWQRAAEEGTLTVRAANSLYLYPALDFEQQLKTFRQLYSNNKDSLLKFNTAKIYIDGILDLGTALMVDPYNNPIDANYPNGFRYFERETLNRYVQALHDSGFKTHFHVIGDAATREALDAIEALDDTAENIASRAHRTTHTYLVHPQDLPRFADLGVIADLQVGEDSTNVDYHADLSEIIGDRAYELLPVPSLIQAGATVSLSSDWDADPLSPLGIIERSLTRESHALESLETAIKLVTLNAAVALSQDTQTGSIEVGKFADYVLLEHNLFEIDIRQISDVQVLETVVNGKTVYSAEGK